LCGSEQAGLDRRFRGIKNLAHGPQPQPLEMFQFKYHALAWRQRLQRGRNVRAQFPAQQSLLWVVGCPVIVKLVQQAVFLALDVAFDRNILPSLSIPSQVIQAKVRDNAVDPSGKGAFEPESGKLGVNLQKCLLMDVLGITLRPGDAQCESENGVIVGVNQLFKSGLVATLYFANQETILDATYVLHSISPPASMIAAAFSRQVDNLTLYRSGVNSPGVVCP
jgi:hypothetical protein